MSSPESGAASFTEKKRQESGPTALYQLYGQGINVGLFGQELRFQLFPPESDEERGQTAKYPAMAPMHEFRIVLEGARLVQPVGQRAASPALALQKGTFYFQGPAGSSACDSVSYPGLYPGIDMNITGRRDGIKYEFRLAPGAEAQRIRLRFEGIAGLSLRADGALAIKPGAQGPVLVDRAPIIYQEIGGKRREVRGNFRLLDPLTLGFEVAGPYDATQPLVIDPEVVWSAYFVDSAQIAVDGSGNIVAVGTTRTPSWTSGGWDTILNTVNGTSAGGGQMSDAFVMKISPSSQHLWSTYLGGIDDESGNAVAVDSAGNIYAAGETCSRGWVSGGGKTTLSGLRDGFLAKLSPAGKHIWSTYLGGANDDLCRGVAVDGAGNPCVTGDTYSPNWVSGGFDTAYNTANESCSDGFVARLSATGQILWSSYLGGSGYDYARGIATDSKGDICLTGYTESSGWVTGGYRTTLEQTREAFAVKLSPAGQLRWNSFIGGPVLNGEPANAGTQGLGIAVDSHDNLCITGTSRAAGWVSGGYDTTPNGGTEGFVAKLSSTGQHLWSTCLGDTSNYPSAIVADSADNLYVTGSAESAPWLEGGLEYRYPNGAFLVRISPAGQYVWAAGVGGSRFDTGLALAIARGADTLYVSGRTQNRDWIGSSNESICAGSRSGFISRLQKLDQVLSGSLTVTIAPPEMITAGAKWRLWGETAWHASGETLTNVLAGSRQLEFSIIPGWRSPLIQTATVNQGSATRTTASYQMASGLRVTLSPPEAVAAGAKWRRTGTTAWLDSGTSEPSLNWGSCTLEFKPLPNWTTPLNQDVSLPMDGKIVEATANYRLPRAELLWSTYLGGSAPDSAQTITTDAAGNIYIAGYTYAGGWIAGGYDTSFAGGTSDPDAFVARLSPDGKPVWGTYLGGSDSDYAYALALGQDGNLCVTGSTESAGWVAGGYDTTQNGDADIFVAKLGPDGRHLWSTYLGGADYDNGACLAIDAFNNIYVTGATCSAGWVSGGFDTTYGGDVYDGFVARFSPSGQLAWSTYLGGSNLDYGDAIAVNSAGEVLAAGSTDSSDWMMSGPNTTLHGSYSDGYLVKLSSGGQRLWNVCLGGVNEEGITSIAIDLMDNIFIGGSTSSPGWLTGGYQATYQGRNGGTNGFVMKLATDGSPLWGTYLGGAGYWGYDYCGALAADAAGNIYAAGSSGSLRWVSGGFDESQNGKDDAFVVEMTGTGQHLWSTYLGGSEDDRAFGLALDPAGSILVCGDTYSSGWMQNGFDTSINGASDVFVAKMVGGNRIEPRGAINVTITPPEAVAAGAQWRRAGQSLWCDSGTTVTQFPAGSVPIEFKPVTNWTPPAQQTVMLEAGQTTAVTASYLRQTGALMVTLEPPEAVAAGAMWRRVGTSTWLASGTTETNVPAGWINIEFKSVANWSMNSIYSIQITPGQTCSPRFTYPQVNNSGTLMVTLAPYEVTTTGAQWRRVGTTTWINSDYSEYNVPAGTWQIEFKTVNQWNTPSRQTVTVTSASLYYNLRAVYERQSGSLKATLTPPEAIAAGAKWRRAGTAAWLAPGVTETAIPTGDWQVEFSRPAGWAPPAPQAVTVNLNQSASLSAAYTPSQADPVWSTYVGGADWDGTQAVAMDSSGNIYITGTTASPDWLLPIKVATPPAGGREAFVTKLSPAGTPLWSVYLGGTSDDSGQGIALDKSGNIFVAGYTMSSGWTRGGYAPAYHGGYHDGFVAKLSPTGQTLWSTCLGGSGDDIACGIAAAADGSVCVVGQTDSSGWVSGGYRTSRGGDKDGFVVKLSGTGQHLWSTYLGGSNADLGEGIALDSAANVYVAGDTSSAGWVSGGLDATWHNGHDAFLVKLSAAGQHLWSTYLGGDNYDTGQAVALDAAGNIFVAGCTSTPGWLHDGYNPTQSREDGFVVKLTNTGQMAWGTYLGGSSSEGVWGLAIDGTGNIFATGYTYSPGWISGNLDNVFKGTYTQAFLVKLSTAGHHLWSTYLGGTTYDYGYAIASDGKGNIAVAGSTQSAGWIAGGYDNTFNGLEDGFVSLIHDNSRPEQLGALQVKLSPASAVAAGAQWRRLGASTWRNSGTAEWSVPAGLCTIEFKPMPGWRVPENATMTIGNGQTVTVYRSYGDPRSHVEQGNWIHY